MSMNWYKTTTNYQTQWQTTIERGLESGQTPLIDLGAGLGELPQLNALVALLNFAGQRADLTSPAIVAGGNSVVWLAGLFYPAYLPRLPALTVLYGGADPAMQLASSALYDSQLSTPLDTGETAIPTYLAPYTTPRIASAVPRWDTLPFLLGGPPSEPQSTGDNLAVQADTWLTWASVGLALALILFAFLV